MADTEELIELVLTGQHPKLRERCIVERIVSVLEDHFGAYDAAGVRAVLKDRRTRSSRHDEVGGMTAVRDSRM